MARIAGRGRHLRSGALQALLRPHGDTRGRHGPAARAGGLVARFVQEPQRARAAARAGHEARLDHRRRLRRRGRSPLRVRGGRTALAPQRADWRQRQRAALQRFVAIIEEGQAQGTIRRDIDVQVVAWSLMGLTWIENLAALEGMDEFVTDGVSGGCSTGYWPISRQPAAAGARQDDGLRGDAWASWRGRCVSSPAAEAASAWRPRRRCWKKERGCCWSAGARRSWPGRPRRSTPAPTCSTASRPTSPTPRRPASISTGPSRTGATSTSSSATPASPASSSRSPSTPRTCSTPSSPRTSGARSWPASTGCRS